MQWEVKLLLLSVVSITLGCYIIPPNNVAFFMVEVPENFSNQDPLSVCVPYKKRDCDILIVNFVDSELGKYVVARENAHTSCIEFYMKENDSLHQYRLDNGVPNLEIDFTLSCSVDTAIYTYMILIKDENLYPPVFSASNYNATLECSSLSGINVIFDEMTGGIEVVDLDFNQQHAEFSITCEGFSCFYFDFTQTCLLYESKKGNQFSINTQFNLSSLDLFRNIESDGAVLIFNLTVTDVEDETKVSSTTVSLNVKWVDGFIGRAVSEPNPSRPSSEVSLQLVPLVAIGSLVVLFIISCTVAVGYLAWRGRKAKDVIRKLTDAEVREFMDGSPSFDETARRGSIDVMNTPIMALPYNRECEILRERLRIDETTILGTGAFGIVWKGFVVCSNGEGITVAVKTVKRNVGVLYFKALLSELKIMAHIGAHPNIVSLVGACTQNIRKREVYVALQYCANGNFHDYLKFRRDGFSNLFVDGNLQLPAAAGYSYNTYSKNGCFANTICTIDLLRWATQIANGLQYLESLGVIHGDLATRNILLDDSRTAKIGDFGLSRRLIDYSNYLYYTKKTQAPLPWKWMAPESLRDMKFSKKSDIWSFGIVLWEMFSLGQTPYPGFNWDESFLGRLEEGMRPSKPTYASIYLYDIMRDCWELNPVARPLILDVKRRLESTTDSILRQKGNLSYMRFLGEQQFIRMLNEDGEGYLLPNESELENYVDA